MEALSIYRSMSKEQQTSMQKVISDKIRGLLGVHGDIAVLVEYIAVMLQSDKHYDLIEKELAAFLQEQSKPFVVWLGEQLATFHTGENAAATETVAQAASLGGKKRPKLGGEADEAPPTRKAAPPRRAIGGVGALLQRAIQAAKKSVADTGAAAAKEVPSRSTVVLVEKPTLVSLPQEAARPRSGARRAERSRRSAERAEQSADGTPSQSESSRSRSQSLSKAKRRRRSSTEKRSSRRNAKVSQKRSAALQEESPSMRHRAAAVTAAVAAAAESTSRRSPRRKSCAVIAAPIPFRAPPPRPVMAALSQPCATLPCPWPPPRGSAPPAPPSTRRRHRDDGGSKRAARLTPANASGDDDEDDDEAYSEEADASRWHFQASGPSPAQTPAAHLTPAPTPMIPTAVSTFCWQGGSSWPLGSGSPPGGCLQPSGPLSYPSPRATPPITVAGAAVTPSSASSASTLAQSAPPRPKSFVPLKWRVCRAQTVVRETEHLDSAVVRELQEGEIVESVGPPFTLPPGVPGAGVVRLEIAHPSSAVYPNPIGWVTQDATAAGGPRYLEPGPQPVQAVARTPRPASFRGAWRPRATPPRPAYRPRTASFSNLTWRPGGA